MISLRKRRGSRYYGRGHTKDAHRGGHGMAGSKAHNRQWVLKVRRREHKEYKPYRDPLDRVLVSALNGASLYELEQTGSRLVLKTHRDRNLIGRSLLPRINQSLCEDAPFNVRMGSCSKCPVVDLVMLLKTRGISEVQLL